MRLHLTTPAILNYINTRRPVSSFGRLYVLFDGNPLACIPEISTLLLADPGIL